ncbi:MAG: cation:proton antiporter [Candidatus Woesearchaeota archaeon]
METQLLINLGILIFFSILGGIISTKLKQPFVLGLLLIGTIIGPNLLGFIKDYTLIDIFIEFGAILFLFIVGMEFSLNKIMKIGVKGLIVSILKVGIMFFIGFLMMILFKFDIVTATFTGVMLSFSSTMIITNVLKQKKLINRSEIPLLITVLVLEDVFGVIALIFFRAMKESGTKALINSLEHLILSLTILILAYIIVSKFAEKIITWIHNNTNDEMILFTSLLLCSAFALLAYYLKLSPSAGAFLAGSIISNFKEAKSFHNSIKPYNFMFTAFFFISMGMMINLNAVWENIFLIILLTISIGLGLTIAVGIVTKIFANYSQESAIFSSIVMLPPGVFSMLVAKESINYGVSVDLISIVSAIILILSLILSLLASKTNLLVYQINKRKPENSKVEKIINTISNYFEVLFDELNSVNLYTRKLKTSFNKSFASFCILIFSFIILKEIIEIPILSKFIYVGIVLATIILIFEAILLIKNLSIIKEDLIKILITLNGGIKSKKIREGTNKLITATIILLISIFFPLIIFALNLTAIFTTISILFFIISIYYFFEAGKILYKFQYHTTNISYKKFDYKTYNLLRSTNN